MRRALRAARARQLLLAAALVAAPVAALAQAAPPAMPHLDGPQFVELKGRLDAPPELGSTAGLSVTVALHHVPRLDVTLDVVLPDGMERLDGEASAPESAEFGRPRPAGGRVAGPTRFSIGRTVEASRPLELKLSLRAERPVRRGLIELSAHAPYPVGALKRWALRRYPLLGPTARRELSRRIAAPPETTEAALSIPVTIE